MFKFLRLLFSGLSKRSRFLRLELMVIAFLKFHLVRLFVLLSFAPVKFRLILGRDVQRVAVGLTLAWVVGSRGLKFLAEELLKQRVPSN